MRRPFREGEPLEGVVMVSHDLEMARAVGFDRLIEMEDLHRVAKTAVDRHNGYIIFYEYRGWCVY